MGDQVDVTVSKVDAPSGHCELVIRATDGTGRAWKKLYDGVVFIGMDAESLGLLEQAPRDEKVPQKLRLRRDASVSLEQLLRHGFRQVSA